MEPLFRLTQKALLSGSFSAADAGAVLRCVDAVVARGSGGCVAYLEADLLKADMSDKGEDGEKNIVRKVGIFCSYSCPPLCLRRGLAGAVPPRLSEGPLSRRGAEAARRVQDVPEFGRHERRAQGGFADIISDRVMNMIQSGLVL